MDLSLKKYACGEMYGDFIVNSDTTHLVVSITNNDDLIELLILLDIMKYRKKKVNLLLIYMYYGRCDKAINDCPITAKTIFNILPDWVENVITINLHNPATLGYFRCKNAYNIDYNKLWKNFIKQIITDNSILVATDFGSGKELIKLAEELKVAYAIGLKSRIGTENKLIELIGDVKDKDCIICDDIVDTGKTLKNIILALKEKGAKSIIGCVTHAVLSNLEVISMFDKLYLGNTINRNILEKNVEILELDKTKWEFTINNSKKNIG